MITPNALRLAAILLTSGYAGSGVIMMSDRLGLELVRIDGGPFQMGNSFEKSNDDALPVHEVVVESFYISGYEITIEQSDTFARTTDRRIPLPDKKQWGKSAVADVSWSNAKAICFYSGGRLPTEIECEYAAAPGEAKQ